MANGFDGAEAMPMRIAAPGSPARSFELDSIALYAGASECRSSIGAGQADIIRPRPELA